MSQKLSRFEQREQILQLVYEKTFHDEPIGEIFEMAELSRDFTPTEFVSAEVRGIEENISDIDAKIAENCKNWSVNRVARVPMCIMRIAVYEMLYCDDIDIGVAINEAVELAKKYGAEDDRSYINGILGSVAATIEE